MKTIKAEAPNWFDIHWYASFRCSKYKSEIRENGKAGELSREYGYNFVRGKRKHWIADSYEDVGNKACRVKSWKKLNSCKKQYNKKKNYVIKN